MGSSVMSHHKEKKRTTTSYNVSCSLTRANRSGSTARLGRTIVECQLRGTSIEAKYNKPIDRGQVQQAKYNKRIDPYIGRGQVQPAHRKSTSIEVKFIKSIETIDNNIGKRNPTTTSRENKEFIDNINKKNP